MITVRKVNNKELVVNCELIKMVEGESDTVITLTTGEKLVVSDRPHEIVGKVIDYRRAVNSSGIDIYVKPPQEREEPKEELATVEE